MKAVIIREFGGVDRLETADWPECEPQNGEVSIRICAAAFNPVDCKLRQGRFDVTLPICLGYDAAGVVESAGSEVTDLTPGDEVYAYLGGPKSNGSYAQVVCVPAAFVARKPKNLTFTQAAAVPLVGLTAYHALVDKARVKNGDSVFIAGGAGGVGTMAIQLARHLGAARIITTAGGNESHTYLTDVLGIPSEHIIRYRGLSVEQLHDRALAANEGQPVDAAFDFWGGDMKKLCCQIIGFDGQVVSIVEEPPNFTLNVFNARKSPMFARCGSLHFEFVGARAMFGGQQHWSMYRDELNALTELLESRSIEPPTISEMNEFSADAVREAHLRLEMGHVKGKLVMPVEHD